MPLKFRHWDDIALERAPVQEVICQVRFRPILAIVEKPPTIYQDKLRRKFPGYKIRRGLNLEGLQPSSVVAELTPNEYVFFTADETMETTLGLNFIALRTTAYSDWNAFRETMGDVHKAFGSIYQEVDVTRIGLRFVNELTHDNTGTKSAHELVSILNPELGRLIENDAWTTALKSQVILSLDSDGAFLTLRSGFEAETSPRILLDFDYYAEGNPAQKLTPARLLKTLNRYHNFIYDAFRWTLRENEISRFGPLQRKGDGK